MKKFVMSIMLVVLLAVSGSTVFAEGSDDDVEIGNDPYLPEPVAITKMYGSNDAF